QPIDWTESGLRSAMEDLRKWAELIARFELKPNSEAIAGQIDTDFLHILSNDLNTPLALGRLQELFHLARSNQIDPNIFASTANFIGFTNLTRPGFYYQRYSANLFSSGPQIGSDENNTLITYRSAYANNLSSSAADAQKR